MSPSMFMRFFKVFILLEALFGALIPLFILFVVFMFLKDNQLFGSPLYITAAAVICIGVLFWAYKSIQDFLKLDDAE